MPMYEVNTKEGYTIANGSLLSELIEHIVILKIKEIPIVIIGLCQVGDQ